MNKEFIPYEQALALKELGFDEPCFGYYVTVEVPNPFLVITKISDTQGGYFTFAPLYSQAFRWFREKYKYNHSIVFTQHPFGTDEYQYMILLDDDEYVEINFKTYEEAELACLKKLIEIVKTK
jgi:hypothetical protein